MNNAEVLLSQDSNLLPDGVKDFIKFARRKTSKLEGFTGDMDDLTKTLNRRGIAVEDLWNAIKSLGVAQEDEVTDDE